MAFCCTRLRVRTVREVARGVREDQEAAGGQRVAQGGDDLPGLVRVGEEVDDGDQEQGDRLVEVDDPADVGVVQDRPRVAQIGEHVAGPAAGAAEQRVGVASTIGSLST